MAAPIPKKIGKYDVLDVIGKGGMGVVYRAKDPFLDRMVAIKIMTISYADYPDLLQRFYREAKATANLQHPNIVTVYELGEHEGSPYLAMQYLEGASLEALLRSGHSITLMQKIDIIIQACHGLSYAHQRGIIHRDIKPGNIMVLKDGSVKIVDFGIARIGDTNFTRTGQFMGSLNYMSLEQLNDKLQVDQRTDVYSTGVVLYQILTGALPFEADSTGATLMKILNEAPPPFSKYLPSSMPELESITMKALAKDRDQRYGSADELALDLTQLLDRMKGEQIVVHMQAAERFVAENQLFQANDALIEVLRLDKQNTKAASMLRTLRKQIEKEQSAERARQLREQAEEAFHREDFDPALTFIEQAIQIDTTNVDLQNFRNKVQAAKGEIEHLRQVMQRAENAHRAGNLDTAKQAIEEVLARRPNDTRVKSLYRLIQKELDDRLRQKRIENLLEAARKEMSNRHFTAALDILKEAEKVDPEAPSLRSLLDSFTTARDQELKRRALEQLTRQIEQALNTDDNQTALNLVNEGLQRFPAEAGLLKLKDLAETQHQAAQTKSYVRERIAAAREILNAGNAGGALKVLQDALRKVPGNAQLESFVSIVKERLTQEQDDQAKSRCLHEANDAIGRRAYDEAIQILEAGQLRFASSEIDNLLRFAREQQVKDAKKQQVENSVRRAQEFLRNQEYDQAISLLESILAATPDEELKIVLEEARRRRDDLNRQIAAAIARGKQFLSEGSPSKAVEFLQSQPTAFRRSDQFRELLLAAAEKNRPVEPAVPEPSALSNGELEAPQPQGTMMWGAGIAPPPAVEPKPTPPVPTGRVTAPQKPTTPTKVSAPAKSAAAPKVVTAKPATAEAAPGLLQRLTQQQKLLIGGALAAVVLVVLAIVMWPSSNLGTLVVRSSTEGADVIVDQAPMGTISKDHSVTLQLKEGHHEVRLKKEGYDPASAEIDVVRGQPVEIPLTLTPSAVPMGTLAVQTSEDGVDVFVDDTLSGTTANKKLTLRVPLGQHRVRVEKSGFDPLPAQPLNIVANNDNWVKFILSRSKTSGEETKPADSYLVITGPEGATVQVQGGSPASGKIPGNNTGFYSKVSPTAPHHVEVTMNGFQNWSIDATAKPGDRQPLRAELKPIPKPKLPPVVDVFTGTPDSVAPGQTVHLQWKTSNATSVEIEGVGTGLETNSGKDVQVGQNTTYKLIAKGEGGSTSASVNVTVKNVPAPKPARILTFEAKPPKIKAGESTTLIWTTSDAQSVSIDGVDANLPANGSKQVTPTQTTDYRIAASNPSGSADTSFHVVVEAKPSPLGDEVPGIRNALDNLQDAYTSLSLDEMVKAWPALNNDSKRKNALKDLFKNVQALRVKFTQCASPLVTGDTAKISCTYSQTNTVSGKVQPGRSLPVTVGLKKANGTWVVTDQTF